MPKRKKTSNSLVKRPREKTHESHFSVSTIILGADIKFVDPPLPKATKKFDEDEKKDNELLRQFRVKISNIEITNEKKEVIDPFIRFIIGGTYFTQIKKRGKDDVYLP